MWGNVFLTIFSYVVGGFLLYSNLKEHKEYRQKLENLTGKRKMEVYDFSKGFRILYIIFAILGISFAIVGYVQNDLTTAAIGVVTGCLFIGQMILTEKRYRLLYDDEGFFSNDTYVPYKTIGDVQTSKIPLVFARIVTLNGKTYAVSKKCLSIIDQKTAEAKAKKQNRRK